VHVELAQVRLIRAERTIGKVPDRLPVMEKIGNRLLDVHAHEYC